MLQDEIIARDDLTASQALSSIRLIVCYIIVCNERRNHAGLMREKFSIFIYRFAE